MVICDRCKKNLGRAFAYGDAVNESFDYLDLCYDCAKELTELIFRFRKGADLGVKQVDNV